MSVDEEWSRKERRKRAKNCDNPKGFTMRNFCRNVKSRSTKGEKPNSLEENLRSLIREMCKRDEYWGRGGAGMMFTCSEDDTVLLLLRADWVDQPGTWGIPGGGVEEGWFRTPIEDPITDMSIFIGAAAKEATEECGSLPPGFDPNEQIVGKTAYEDCGFQYITFIADISAEQKDAWHISLADGESADFIWAPMRHVRAGARIKGKPLHFGVEYTISRM